MNGATLLVFLVAAASVGFNWLRETVPSVSASPEDDNQTTPPTVETTNTQGAAA